MKVLFLTDKDPREVPLLWSGTALSMLRGLEALGHTVHVQTVGHNASFPYMASKWRFYRWFLGQEYIGGHDPICRWFARRKLRKELRGQSFDLVFSWLPWYLLLLDTDKPKVFWYDTTFIKTQPMYYPNLCRESTRDAVKLDGQIAREASAAIYPSAWACESAVKDYGADPRHVHLIPFGANFPAPAAEETTRAIERRIQRRSEPMRLLFVGMDWQRKGGDVAVAVTREINRRGVPARLTVVGCQPQLPADDMQFVEITGRLNKSRPDELARMQSLYLESDFFIMPSRAESAAIVYCEAMGSGCPSLATRTGGIDTIVRDDVTGRLVNWSPNTVSELADYAIKMRGDSAAYRALCESCRRTFASEFTWELGWQRLGKVLDQVMSETISAASAPRESRAANV